MERDLGVELSRATLDGWVLRVGELLMPMARAMQRELLNSRYLQADETPVPVQMHDGRGQHHQAYLWQYGQPGGTVVFDFRLGRGREGPKFWIDGGPEGSDEHSSRPRKSTNPFSCSTPSRRDPL